MYSTGAYCRLLTYNGTNPFTGDALSEYNLRDIRTATEILD